MIVVAAVDWRFFDEQLVAVGSSDDNFVLHKIHVTIVSGGM